MKILERYNIRTIDGGEYTLVTTGAIDCRVGFITGQGPTTGRLDSVRCMWTQAVTKGQPLTLKKKIDPDTLINPVLVIPTIAHMKKRRFFKSWPRWVEDDPATC